MYYLFVVFCQKSVKFSNFSEGFIIYALKNEKIMSRKSKIAVMQKTVRI